MGEGLFKLKLGEVNVLALGIDLKSAQIRGEMISIEENVCGDRVMDS